MTGKQVDDGSVEVSEGPSALIHELFWEAKISLSFLRI